MGCLYFIQPAELLNTNRYKIGCSSKNDLSRMKAYKKNTRHICIMECEEYYKIERILINHFKYKYNLIAGAEYFEGDENEMLIDFINIIVKNNLTSELPIKNNLPQVKNTKITPINLFTKYSFKKK